jgi:hypothetical protein
MITEQEELNREQKYAETLLRQIDTLVEANKEIYMVYGKANLQANEAVRQNCRLITRLWREYQTYIDFVPSKGDSHD